MSPIINVCRAKKLPYFIIHTNQHYSPNLDKIFFRELNLPQSRYNLNVGSGTHAAQTGQMLLSLEKVLAKEKPSIVLVQGDTNTVLAAALTAAKMNIMIGHVEAGLRSYDRSMPEETNRILTDHMADFLFVPTPNAQGKAIKEGISKSKIFITGNTIVDAVNRNLAISEKKCDVMKKFCLDKNNYFLVTIHRQENVDSSIRFRNILTGLKLLHKQDGREIIYSIHPRSRKMIASFRLKVPAGIRIIEPVGFFEFLQLEKNAGLILTDSGGVQEEACILGKPCVTLRENTERPETVKVGANIITGTEPGKIFESARYMLESRKKWKDIYGDGHASERIIKIIQEKVR